MSPVSAAVPLHATMYGFGAKAEHRVMSTKIAGEGGGGTPRAIRDTGAGHLRWVTTQRRRPRGWRAVTSPPETRKKAQEQRAAGTDGGRPAMKTTRGQVCDLPSSPYSYFAAGACAGLLLWPATLLAARRISKPSPRRLPLPIPLTELELRRCRHAEELRRLRAGAGCSDGMLPAGTSLCTPTSPATSAKRSTSYPGNQAVTQWGATEASAWVSFNSIAATLTTSGASRGGHSTGPSTSPGRTSDTPPT